MIKKPSTSKKEKVWKKRVKAWKKKHKMWAFFDPTSTKTTGYKIDPRNPRFVGSLRDIGSEKRTETALRPAFFGHGCGDDPRFIHGFRLAE